MVSPLPSDPENPAAQRNGTPGKKKGAKDGQTNMNGPDFAKAIGINKPANVRDKIKRWQQEVEPDAADSAEKAGASASATDSSPPKTTPAPAPKSAPTTPKTKPIDDKPNWKPAHAHTKSVDARADRSPSPKKTPVAHNKLDDEVFTATAPKKRVISDSRWRSKQSPPKEATRPAPKTIPNAWVRPSKIVKKDRQDLEEKALAAPVPEKVEEKKPDAKSPQPIPPPVKALVSYVGRSTGQKKAPQKQRRPSKPSSSENERPASNGSGSAAEVKSEEDGRKSTSPKPPKVPAEIVKVRRRPRARTSPRGSLSAEDIATTPRQRPARRSETSLVDDAANIVTVEYEESDITAPRPITSPRDITSPRNDELRERRRRRRPKSQGDVSGNEARRGAISPSRRHRRRSSPRTSPPKIVSPPPEPAGPATAPTKGYEARLEAWLQGTPDPFVEKDSRRRPKSRESISTLELPPKAVASDVTASTESKDKPQEEQRPRSSGSGSRRRRRRRSREIKIDTKVVNEPASTIISDETTEVTLSEITASEITASEITASEFTVSEVTASEFTASEVTASEFTASTMTASEFTASEVTASDITASTVTATDKDSEVSLSPTPTLKRRGARRSQHSPSKSRSISSPLRETMSVDDEQDKESVVTSRAPSSSVDSSIVEMEHVELRPRPLSVQRGFPSRGKRLSTIASADSFASRSQGAPRSAAPGSDFSAISEETSTATEVPASDAASYLNPETSTMMSRRSTRRRKLAAHSDLMSVLSMPKPAGSKSIVSARSIRTNRSRLATATISDIMRELASDESKFMRELRTLVDGVIPVLLSCVLSKTDSAVAVGLFSRSANTDSSTVTKPIVDMGVSLERLKTLHKRVPKEDPEAFVSWAQSAQRVYADYIASWRLGFQDVVISLAPADDDPFQQAKVVDGPEDGAPWDEGMPRNAEGYVVNGDGERVDVAYMLKRPLVRLKYLAKTLKGVNFVKPSERAEKVSGMFQDLVNAARKRSNDEHARLEDEAAANIDATRARDPRSLAPLAGVRIDPQRCVRARDHFDLHLYHSSGQEVSCRVEILMRDDAPGTGNSGDLLFCEVDATGRWLLLPPIQQNLVSARNGDLKGEIIVMIRGVQTDASEWSEVMSLTSDDEQAGFEWVQMLGLTPIPPQISEIRTPSKARPTSGDASYAFLPTATASALPQKSRTPSPHEIEIPIGEQHTEVSKVWHYDTPEKRRSRILSPNTPPSREQSQVSDTYDAGDITSPIEELRPEGHEDPNRTPRTLNEAVRLAGTGSPTGLKRTRAKRLSKNASSSSLPRASRQITLDDPAEIVEEPKPVEETIAPRRKSTKRRGKNYSVWMPTSEVEYSDESEEDGSSGDEVVSPPGSPPTSPQRPQAHRRVSSVPSMELPSIPRSRKTSQPTTPVKAFEDSVEPPALPASAPPATRRKHRKPSNEDIEELDEQNDEPPPPPPHRSPSPATPVTLKGSKTPVFTPTLPAFRNKRRSSSPLKHEYEPSTCTETSSESEDDDVVSEEDVDVEEEDSLTSDSSEDELDDDVPMPLMPIGYIGPRGYNPRPHSGGRDAARPSRDKADSEDLKKFPKVSPPSSIYTLPNGTITPSQSASNTPYRTVPQGSGQATKAIASIFAWSEAGRWDSLHPDECSIVVTPGKIEVFEITAIHSKPFLADGDEIFQPEGRAPLVAVELTPLVPLRKSTAIDISIRSPPTAESRIKTGNNIMLRSRNAAECAQLYAMINQSRINNPTYIALQNARGPYGQTSWAEAMDRQNAARADPGASSGWLSGTLGRRTSYRKTSTRAASISAATDSSVGTMNSALRSALGRFSWAKNGVFSVRNSTLGSRSTGSSFDAGSSGGSGSSTPNGDGRAPGAPAGITNTKCRLYERETLKKWRDMGSARLTIMLPSPNPSAPSSPSANPLQRAPGQRDAAKERRIVVTGKKDEVLLDVTLSESCFERVARSGIAVSVWEDLVGDDGHVGRVAKTGGVSGARARVFMIQMKSERECAYCYGLLGKLRY